MIDKRFKCLPVSFVLDLPGVELLSVDIVTHDGPLRLVVCYRSTSLASMSFEMNFRLINCLIKLLNVRHSSILMGDFNLPKINWNCDIITSDPIHLAFYENFCSLGLSQLINFPTRDNAILDLVFCNDPGLICDIVPLPPLGVSDHDMISFSVLLPDPPKSVPLQVPIKNYSKCNYVSLNADLNEIDWNAAFINCITSDEYWSVFSTKLSSLLDLHCPTFLPKSGRKNCNYPSSIKRLQSLKTRAWRRLKLNKHSDHLQAEYKAACFKYSEAVNNYHYERESAVLN